MGVPMIFGMMMMKTTFEVSEDAGVL